MICRLRRSPPGGRRAVDSFVVYDQLTNRDLCSKLNGPQACRALHNRQRLPSFDNKPELIRRFPYPAILTSQPKV